MIAHKMQEPQGRKENKVYHEGTKYTKTHEENRISNLFRVSLCSFVPFVVRFLVFSRFFTPMP